MPDRAGFIGCDSCVYLRKVGGAPRLWLWGYHLRHWWKERGHA